MRDLDLNTIVFYVLAAVAVLGALGILVSRNIVRTAMWLLATLGAAAGLYFLLGAPFVGAIQLIVYAGGTLVLIIFGVMLTARNPNISYTPKRSEIAIGLILCILLAGVLIWVLNDHDWPRQGKTEQQLASMPAKERDTTPAIGELLLGQYLVPFEIVSLLLLAVLIGSAYLGRPKVPIIGVPAHKADEPAAPDQGGSK